MQATNSNLPFVERHRPDTLDDIFGHENIISAFKLQVKKNRLGHMLLYGPAGTGKTSSALACAKALYGDYKSKMVLELNASDERGIDVVRNEIKTFISSASLLQKHVQGLPKMVILDEADQMTGAAQAALRRLVEKFSQNARFVFICNHEERMIHAIRSRCMKFRFGPLSTEHVTARIRQVAEKEGIQISEEAVSALNVCSEGDLRRALNYLQQASIGRDNVEKDLIYQKAGRASPEQLLELSKLMLNAKTVTEGKNAVKKFTLDHACSTYDLLNMLESQLLALGIPDEIYWEFTIPELGDLQVRAAAGVPDNNMHVVVASIFLKTNALMTTK